MLLLEKKTIMCYIILFQNVYKKSEKKANLNKHDKTTAKNPAKKLLYNFLCVLLFLTINKLNLARLTEKKCEIY